jgi:ankyrin repeat protein
MESKLAFYKIFILIVFLSLIYNIELGYSEREINRVLLNAAAKGDFLTVQESLEKGADINTTLAFNENHQFTALGLASASGNSKIVKYLLKNGANPEGSPISPNLPIYYAIVNNIPEIVDILLKTGIDPNYAWRGKEGGTLLIIAAQQGLLEMARLLVEKYNADVNFTGESELSALYRTIIYEQMELMSFLIDNGAKLNTNDKLALEQIKWFENRKNDRTIRLLKLKSAL